MKCDFLSSEKCQLSNINVKIIRNKLQIIFTFKIHILLMYKYIIIKKIYIFQTERGNYLKEKYGTGHNIFSQSMQRQQISSAATVLNVRELVVGCTRWAQILSPGLPDVVFSFSTDIIKEKSLLHSTKISFSMKIWFAIYF